MQLSSSVNQTMSSREIAQLVSSKHGDVKRSADRLAAAGILTAPLAQFEFEHNGNTYIEYRFNKRDSLVLVARLSPEFTAAVVDRWQELESPAALSRMDILKLAMDSEQRAIEAENQLAIAAPKIDFADRVSEASGVLIGNYSKAVGVGQNKLFAWLRDSGVLISGGSRHNMPKQEYMERRYFSIKETPVETNHGVQISFTTLITGKGQQWLTRKLLDAGILKAVGNAA